ncbi:MAG TPA: FxsA family protein [Myxococcota bacterium]|nr:FxsA family protein [Myxococcota bacterium]
MLKLFLLFTVTTSVELFLLIKIGEHIGALATVGIILTTGAIGSWLAKREGLGVLKKLETESRAGFPSGNRIVEGLLILVGCVLLVTPGVLTDAFGFALLIPFTRERMAPHVKRYLLKKFGMTAVTGDAARVVPPQSPPAPSTPTPFDHPEG